MLKIFAWVKEWINPFFNEDKSIENIIYNVITMLAFVAGLICCLSSVILRLPIQQVIIISVIVLVVIFGLYIANFRQQFDMASFITCCGISVILLPLMYILGGGSEGGMPIYLVLGIIVTFCICKGIVLISLLLAEILVYSICILTEYYYPEVITSFSTRAQKYTDTWQSVIIVSLLVGLMIKFQVGKYKNILKQLEEQKRHMEILKQEAERASMSKSEFLANMSHEIRTPMNAIIGMAKIALNEGIELEESTKSHLQDILTSSNTLLAIINDILDFSKIESGKLEIVPKPMQLSTIIHDLITVIKIRVEEKLLELKIDIDPTIPNELFGDEVRVKQVLINILNNAVKFTEAGSITLKVTWKKKDNMADIFFSIIDTGQGIREENLDNIFERFSRAELTKNRSIEGTGLGLAISKQLAKMMDGDITVESEYGKGSTFTVCIRFKVLDDNKVYGDGLAYRINENDDIKLEGVSFPGAKVLVVDDNMMNLKVAQGLLKNYKMVIDVVDSGMACIEACKNCTYDLVLLDHMMPNMDGIETLVQLRRLSGFHTPVIALTANAVNGAEKQYYKVGFNGYIAKPIKTKELEKSLLKFLTKYRTDKVKENGNADSIQKEIEEVKEAANNRETIVENKEESKFEVKRDMVKDDFLDEKVGLEYLGDSMEMYIEVLEIYIEETAENIEKMKGYLSEGNWLNYATLAHATKSNSRLIGLPKLGDFAYEFELKGKAGDADFIKAGHEDFIASIEYARELVKQYLEKNGN